MLALKYILMLVAVLSIAATLIMMGYHLWLVIQFRRKLARGMEDAAAPVGLDPGRLEPGPLRWRFFVGMTAIGCVSLFIANSIVVLASGMGGVRVSQTRGTLPGTLYSGVHFVTPLVEQLQTFDLRDKLFTTGMVEDGAVNATSVPGGDRARRDVQDLIAGVRRPVQFRAAGQGRPYHLQGETRGGEPGASTSTKGAHTGEPVAGLLGAAQVVVDRQLPHAGAHRLSPSRPEPTFPRPTWSPPAPRFARGDGLLRRFPGFVGFRTL